MKVIQIQFTPFYVRGKLNILKLVWSFWLKYVELSGTKEWQIWKNEKENHHFEVTISQKLKMIEKTEIHLK